MVELKGAFTALITPYKGSGVDNEVDWDGLQKLVENQNGKVAGIVPCGTTGESPTLTHEEHDKVIEKVIEHHKGHGIVIAGTGSNSTLEAVEMSRHAKDAGADATLQVCPYYNKPNQEGLYRHFAAIAEKVDIPHVVYNIPGRSSRNIEPETIARLAKEYSNIVAVKEATGNEESWKKTEEICGDGFAMLSGNDGETYDMMSKYGGKGVISVASNIIPQRIQDFVQLGLEEKFDEMSSENRELSELFEVLFVDTNPIPVKAAANMMGLPGGGYRLPMCEMSDEKTAKLREALQKYKLI